MNLDAEPQKRKARGCAGVIGVCMRKYLAKVDLPSEDEVIALVAEIRERPWRDPVTGRWSVAAGHLIAPLWLHSFAVLQAFLRDGTIGEHLGRLGYPLSSKLTDADHELIRTSTEVREDLAAEMILRALPKFLDNLAAGVWDLEGTAAVSTAFVNACLLRFNRVAVPWARARRARPAGPDLDPLERMERMAHGQPHHVADQLQLGKLIAIAPVLVRPILELYWLGYTREEVAAKLEISREAVSTRLHYWRKEKLIPMVQTRRLIPPAGYKLAEFSPDYVADVDVTEYQDDAEDIGLFTAGLFGGPVPEAAQR